MPTGLIYKVTNIQNKKIYIGFTTQTLEIRKQGHIHFSQLKSRRQSYFHDAIKSYGVNNFKWEILGYCGTLDGLKEAEIECIYFFRSFGSDGSNFDTIYGYNHTFGGEGIFGYKCTENQKQRRSEVSKGRVKSSETRKKLSEANKGRKFTEEHKKNLSLALMGRVISVETRKKISENNIGKKLSDDTKQKMSVAHAGENNPMFGKNAFENKTEEEMQVISEKISRAQSGESNSFYGKKHTDETRKKISEYYLKNGANFLGKHHTEESKQKLSKSHTINLPIDEIVDYYYNKNLHPSDICKFYGCSANTIIRRLQQYKKDNNLPIRKQKSIRSGILD
jgi:group I intron endonuclease